MTNGFFAQTSLLASGEGDGFHSPSLDEFFPPAILFEGTPFEINRVILVRLVAVAVLALACILYSKRAKLVPGRWQNVFESILDFSRVQIGQEILGEKARAYQPLLATLFLGIFFMNVTSVIPGLQIAATSVIGMPLIYAVVAYVAFIYAGIKAHGGHFFRQQLMPAGVPAPLYVLMTPIELISTFVLRPVTLAVRLLVNMVSGHLLLVLCFVSTHYLYFHMGGFGYLAGTLTLAGGLVFTIFEAFVAGLQAYIFALLSAVYISLSLEH